MLSSRRTRSVSTCLAYAPPTRKGCGHQATQTEIVCVCVCVCVVLEVRQRALLEVGVLQRILGSYSTHWVIA